ncbi:patatin-like phospholipase family protein [Ottowia caeni]|uniref:patatin-like phospholipase family protein n=1 Tax=Ottowia caeni TaxID=2870339 RepID=UPI003D7499C8
MTGISSTLPLGAVRAMDASELRWQAAVGNLSVDGGLLGKLRGVFRTPTKGVETLINAREAFKSFFQDQVSALAPKQRNNLIDQSQGLMQQILANSLDRVIDHAIQRKDGRVSDSMLREAVARANESARLALGDLQLQVSRARITEPPAYDMRPQILLRPDQTILLVRPAPLIENLVLRGGGAKGVANGVALLEMESAGLLEGLKKIVGSSVGALTAVALASGQDAKAFARLSDSLSMTELAAKPRNFEKLYPHIDVSWRLGFHSGRALELLDQISATNVAGYLESNWNTNSFQQKLLQLQETAGPRALERLAQLTMQDFQQDRTDQMITFNDLSLLHQLDPARFKELVLTGWDKDNRTTTYFSTQMTPNMPIAVAGRISMAFPIAFKSVTYDPGDGLGTRTFSDGGIGSNMPTEVVTGNLTGNARVEAFSRTALLTFDENGEAYSAMHGPQQKRNGAVDWIISKVTGNPDFGQSSLNDDAKVKGAGPNAYVVFHGDLGTLDLLASRERLESAKHMSTLNMLQQIEQREGQAYAVECATIDDCWAMLTDTEKQLLSEGVTPDPREYRLGVSDPAYRLQRQLYQLAVGDTASSDFA